MRNAEDVITTAVNGYTEELAAEYEVSTARMYQLLSTHCSYPKTKILIRRIAGLTQAGARLIKADIDALWADVLHDIDPLEASVQELHKESSEAVQSVLNNDPIADQKNELRQAMAATAKVLQKLDRLPLNGHGPELRQKARETIEGRRR